MKKSNTLFVSTPLFLFIFCLCCTLVKAGNYTWNGSSNNQWTKTANWTPSGTPSGNDTITVTTATNNLVLDANQTVYRLIMQNDSMDLGGYTLIASGSSAFSAGYITNGTLDLRGSNTLFSGTILNATVNASCTTANFNGSTFNQPVTVDITGNNANTSNGSNVFNNTLWVSNSGGAPVVFASTTGDVYNGNVTVFDTLTKTILFGSADTSFFNGHIYINSKGAGVSFGYTTGYVKLAAGKTITVGTKGFSKGTLLLHNIIQSGTTAQNITLTGSAIASLVSCLFGGDITLTSPNILVKNSTFTGKSYFSRSSSISNSWEGGNTFTGVFRFTNTGSGSVFMQTNNGDSFADSVTFNGGTARLYPATVERSVFSHHVYFTGSNVDFSQGVGSVAFTGSANQVISGPSNLSFKNLEINKSSGTLALNCPITITGTLDFVNGNMITDTTHLLTFANGSSWMHGSNTSFVNGPVKKVGKTAFTFPIGAGMSKSIAGISAPINSTDAFTAQYFEGENPLGNTLDTSLQSISKCGYWKIARTTGTSTVNITLGWDTLPCQNYYDTLIKMGTWDGNKWKKIAIQAVSGNSSNMGQITTNSHVSAFTYFVFANVTSVPVNFEINLTSTGIPRTISDYFGYNVWDIVESSNQALYNQDFQTAQMNLSPGTLRFPASIEENWWDWRNGTFIRDLIIGNTTYYLPEVYHDVTIKSDNGLAALSTDFFQSVYKSGATPFFCYNILTSDVFYQTALLYHARNHNIPVQLIEFGGEVYKTADYNDIRFPFGKDYADISIDWGKKTKSLFNLSTTNNTTNFQIGFCAARFDNFSNTERTNTWNSSMFNQLAAQSSPVFVPDAIIIHDYIGAGLNFIPIGLTSSPRCGPRPGWTDFDSYRIVSPFDLSNNGVKCTKDMDLIFSSVFRNFLGEYGAGAADYKGFVNEELDPANTNPEHIPGNNEIWITEYNTSDKFSIFRGTWAHGLSAALQTMVYLESERITKVNIFKIIGDAFLSAIFGGNDGFNLRTENNPTPNENSDLIAAAFTGQLDGNDHFITVPYTPTSAGYTLGLLAKAMRNADHANNLIFNGGVQNLSYFQRTDVNNPLPIAQQEIYGWYFTDSLSNEQQAIIINLSDDEIDLSGNILSQFNGYEQIYADPASFISGNSINGDLAFNSIPGHELVIQSPVSYTTAPPFIKLHKYAIIRLFSNKNTGTGTCAVTLKPLWDRVCSGTTGSLTAFGYSNPSFIYDWQNTTNNGALLNGTAGLITPTGNTITFTVDPTATNSIEIFQVTVTDNFGCTATATASVTLVQAPEFTITSPSQPYVVCKGDAAQIEVKLTNSASSWGANYILINSLGKGVADFFSGTANSTATFNFSPDTSADYTVYVYDGDCVLETEVIPIIVPQLELGQNIYLCSNESFEVTEALVPLYPGAAYAWYDGAPTPFSNDAHLFLTPTNNMTTYTLAIDYANCSFSDAFTIYTVSCCSTIANTTNFLKRINTQDLFDEGLGNFSGNGSTLQINNESIAIADGLTITGHDLQLRNCTLYVSEGADILVDFHFKLTLLGTKIIPCSKMWEGIILNPTASLTTNVSGSNIRTEVNGAQYAIRANDHTYMDLSGTDFTQNYVSVYVPPSQSNPINQIFLSLSDIKFSCIGCSTNILPLGFAGQTTTNGNYSFAGVYLNDMVGTIGIAGTDPVEFSDLNNGIIGINSSLLVTNSTFKNIWRFDPSYTMPTGGVLGTGIFAAAEQGKYGSLTQVGLGLTSWGNTPDLTFNDCVRGIHTNNVSTDISNNRMDDILNAGVRCENAGSLPAHISFNQIGASFSGIHLGNCGFARDLIVEQNSIFTATNHSGVLHSGILYNGMLPLSSGKIKYINHSLHCNTISGDFYYGMFISGMLYLGSVTANNIDISSSSMERGIYAANNSGFYLNSNTVYGYDAEKGVAYDFFKNNNLLISDNLSQGTGFGFRFTDANANTRFITNQIGYPGASGARHNVGLKLIAPSSDIGFQYITNLNNGATTVYNNQWVADPTPSGDVYSSNHGAENDNGLQSSITSQFRVQSGSTSGDEEYPNNICSNILNGPWFFPKSNYVDLSSGYSNECIVFHRNENESLATEIDRLVAKDSVFFDLFEDQMRFTLQSNLQEMLLSNDSLVENDSLLGAFFESKINAPVGQLSSVRHLAEEIFTDDDETLDEILKNDSLIRLLHLRKATIDTLLQVVGNAYDSLALLNESGEVIRQIASYIYRQNDLLLLLNDNRQSKVDAALNLNANISATEAIEENEQIINSIYFEKVIYGNLNLDSTELSNVDYIAPQCPIEGGRAVFTARAIKYMRGDSTIYDDSTACAGSGSRLANKSKSENNLYINVTPNPASDNCIFNYLLPLDKKGEIQVLQVTGKVIVEIKLKENTTFTLFSTNQLKAGVYLYRLISDEEIVGIGKLVIVK